MEKHKLAKLALTALVLSAGAAQVQAEEGVGTFLAAAACGNVSSSHYMGSNPNDPYANYEYNAPRTRTSGTYNPSYGYSTTYGTDYNLPPQQSRTYGTYGTYGSYTPGYGYSTYGTDYNLPPQQSRTYGTYGAGSTSYGTTYSQQPSYGSYGSSNIYNNSSYGTSGYGPSGYSTNDPNNPNR